MQRREWSWTKWVQQSCLRSSIVQLHSRLQGGQMSPKYRASVFFGQAVALYTKCCCFFSFGSALVIPELSHVNNYGLLGSRSAAMGTTFFSEQLKFSTFQLLIKLFVKLVSQLHWNKFDWSIRDKNLTPSFNNFPNVQHVSSNEFVDFVPFIALWLVVDWKSVI